MVLSHNNTRLAKHVGVVRASHTFKLTLHAYLSLYAMLGTLLVNLPHAFQVLPMFALQSSLEKLHGLPNNSWSLSSSKKFIFFIILTIISLLIFQVTVFLFVCILCFKLITSELLYCYFRNPQPSRFFQNHWNTAILCLIWTFSIFCFHIFYIFPKLIK